ncbi:UPF0132 membrane protein [Colletotrichum sp. SAR11_59]|uniref:Upf0132 domain protein n=3 Tax=Colletotrichum gloeosporioides species complex TaxID=2707338 RepID=A0A8H3W4C6_9PEZI|nr:UPF0132 membrane protein [Colletotrichum siamense]XP_037175116.1 UPF0132 membrane protein [Colletotrichum aenigma]KAF0318003.1 upf0132 domain protein [Colletotrichum asianum]KAF4817234.1 UPF0132 membrane protein [Colletotrichum tropicale]KAH0440426.1 upf0132 domain protein [Colletotrichum camelliae]KAI8163612.1 UPF0132 membrane protein [Colletotrichum sp. SAR 10_71]KAI8190048.1 UPF0132 membrane protein [Colletotrichum sp. SAR 10_75]KAI8194792.1 UPF0132 membrane protein [Colletotrichum sp.
MDFAPYQSSPPERERALSPPLASPRASADFRRPFSPYNQPSPPPLQHPQPQRGWQPSLPGSYPSADAHREGVSEFDTSLGIRLDYEAALAYLAFPPLGAILLLIGERNSDYVRFHAWQSALLFTAVMIFHLVFLSWSAFLSWLFFIGDVFMMIWLALKAYQDADTLDRFEVPIIGALASRILDDE